MKAIELLSKLEIFPRLQKLFPEFVETSRDITVIPWREEFQMEDKNPEVIDTLEFLEILFKNKMISDEEYHKQVNNALSVEGPISRAEEIAFIENREIAFRSLCLKPDVIIHEIGHVH